MNKKANGTGLFILKAMCIALTLILGTSLFAMGAVTEAGCGEKCRCHRRPMNMDHSMGGTVPLSADLCNGDPLIPCNVESSQTSELPQFISGSVGFNYTPTVGPADLIADSVTNKHDSRSEVSYQFSREQSRSAPIFLQNASFLI